MIPTVEENLSRLREIRAKMLEYVDFITTWEEAEMRKREATETPFQEKDENFEDEDVQDEEKVTEDEEA